MLYRHWQENNKDEAEPEFTVEVIKSHRSATERQIWEALQIQGGKHDELINSKSEWGMNCLVRQETAFDREVRTVNKEAEGNSRATPDSGSSFQTQFRQRKKQVRIEKQDIGQLTDRSEGPRFPSLFDHGEDRTERHTKKRKL